MEAEDDFKSRLRFRRMVSKSTVAELLPYIFPRMSVDEIEQIVKTVKIEGVSMASELRNLRAGALIDQGVSEWVCKALAAKNLIQPGLPTGVYQDGYEVMKQNLSSSTSKLDQGLFSAQLQRPTPELLQRLQQQVRPKSWLELAERDMDLEESEVVPSLFSKEEIGALYGYRALLRIIAREAPVEYKLQDDLCFLGSFYFECFKGGQYSAPSSSSESTRDWSRVVWVMQVVSSDIEYREALGRMVQATRKILHYQPQRKFAHGVVAGQTFVDIYMFSNSGPEIPTRPLLADWVSKFMFSLHRSHSGFAALVHLMCAPPALHGYQDMDGVFRRQ